MLLTIMRLPVTIALFALRAGEAWAEVQSSCSSTECRADSALSGVLLQQMAQLSSTNGIMRSDDLMGTLDMSGGLAESDHSRTGPSTLSTTTTTTTTTLGLSGQVGGLLLEVYYLSPGISTVNVLDGLTVAPDVTLVDTAINYFTKGPGLTVIGMSTSEHFAAKWTGGLRIQTAGSYTLSLTSDDGSVMFLDGAMVVDNDGPHGMITVSTTLDLSAGDHTLQVKFYQAAGGQGIIMEYSGPDTRDDMVVVLPSALVLPTGVSPPTTATTTALGLSAGDLGGVLAEFFYLGSAPSSVSVIDGLTQAPDVSRIDTTINYPTTGQAWNGLSVSNNYVARWSGALRVQTAGWYTLSLRSDDGSVLLLNDSMVVDNDGLHGMRTVSATVHLGAGDHPLLVKFCEAGGGAGLIFTYSGPDTANDEMVVPAVRLVAPVGQQPPTPDTSIPRNELWNVHTPQRTEFQVPTTRDNDLTDHNKCNANTPDGRLYFCGEGARYVRYFKFESLEFAVNGVPIFSDDSWSRGPERMQPIEVDRPNEAAVCFPNWKQPFEVLADGSHRYSMYTTTSKARMWVNVTVENPMTPQAEIVRIVRGVKEDFAITMPKYAYFTMDGRMVVGSKDQPTDTRAFYTALPESAEPCSLDGWHDPRPLHELHTDPDGLSLPARYPFARHVPKDGLGVPFSDAHPQRTAYTWFDLDARNVWLGSGDNWRVMGEDTSGIEYMMDGGINKRSAHSRWMSSPLWNFESERTAAQRYPGELHTSGVGSGAAYQLPMSKAHHVLPVFGSEQEFYTETELFNVWKSPHWDIFFLPMTITHRSADQHASHTPDLSRHFLNGSLVGSINVKWDCSEAIGTPQAVGSCMEFHAGHGAVVVDLSSAQNVDGVTSPVRAFTAQMAFRTYWSGQYSSRWLLNHPNISLTFGAGVVTWTFNGQSFQAGSYVTNEWQHVALVFDGVDQTVTCYNNGFEIATVTTLFTSFQLGTTHPVVIGSDSASGYATGINGLIDNVRFMTHARSQRNVCKSAFQSDCGDAISYHPTTTQYELSMQIKECSAATMHTIACYAAIHRVCANLDAMIGKDAGISNDDLGALTPPGPPVSMAGVPVAFNHDTVDVACTPNVQHLSVPVDWHIMEKYDRDCDAMTDHASIAFHCNLAAHAFCKDAFTDIDSNLATGVIFEADARAWVTCFAAHQVVTEDVTAIAACVTDLESAACQVEVSGLCPSEDGGLVQSVSGDILTIHCFNAPVALGVHTFTI